MANTTFAFDRQDVLRGSNGTGRNYWDVVHYNMHVTFDTANKSISGYNEITISITDTPNDSLQLDLQEPMVLDSVLFNNQKLSFSHEENVWWINTPESFTKGKEYKLTAYYHGKPRQAKMPPWDGGLIWTKDSTGKPWISVACQGLGASVWWPCKDYQADEPDNGMDMHYTVPEKLDCISNGRLIATTPLNNKKTWHWQVVNPINTYNVAFYIGDYVHWSDTLMGENGKLSLDFYALDYNESKAREQFAVVKPMLHCFEYWMGPYPFYEDGYKLVEAPFLGMEHQSAVAYGNEYKMGYLGMDRSGSGVGLKFDFIIVHESGHEWYGNNITAADIADNWIHEGFTTYTEALFAECLLNKEAAYDYARGEWKNITNHKPVIGKYGLNNDGSPDRYDKGAAIVHMIRVMMDDDKAFRKMLRSMNKEFYHQTVSSKEIENYISKAADRDLAPFFEQYLRTTDIPKLRWYIKENRLYFKFTNVVDGFTMPVPVTDGNNSAVVNPTDEWQSIKWKGGYNISFSNNFLIKVKP